MGLARQIRIPVERDTEGNDITPDKKRTLASVENRLHHVLDDTFREDRCPAKKSKNNLALIREFVYNILLIAMLAGDCNKWSVLGSIMKQPWVYRLFILKNIWDWGDNGDSTLRC